MTVYFTFHSSGACRAVSRSTCGCGPGLRAAKERPSRRSNDSGNKSSDELASEVKKFAIRLSVSGEIRSRQSRVITIPTYVKKTFDFDFFPRTVYCNLTDIEVQLTQTGLGSGFGYLKFTQNCNSRWGDRVPYPDWDFTVSLRDSGGAFIRNIHLGSWGHHCGRQLIELQEDFTWVQGSINPIEFASDATLTWTWKQQVSPC